MSIKSVAEPRGLEATARPFYLADAMILIAAIFVALAWDRPHVLDPLRGVSEPGVRAWWPAEVAAGLIALGLQLLVVASLAVFLLRLRSPRPSAALLLRQPGMAACALASAATLAVGSAVLASHALAGRPPALAWARAMADLKPDRLMLVASLIGVAVLLAWITLGAKRQLRPEASWIDRLGRVVGVGWIAMIPGGLFLFFLRLAGLIRILR